MARGGREARARTCVAASLVLVTTAVAPLARAQAPTPERASGPVSATSPPHGREPLVVLTLDSDGPEDQAEALTGAIRSRLFNSPRWSLREADTSFGMLTAALKCPEVPDAACLTSIAHQIHVEHFIWGRVTKSQRDGIVADVHLWSKGRDIGVKHALSENLRDQNDEVLRRIAGRILQKLEGRPVATWVTVRAGTVDAPLFVDGVHAGDLDHGQGVLELDPGVHAVEVRAEGFEPESRRLSVGQAGSERLDLRLRRVGEAPVDGEHKPLVTTRTAIGLGALAVGIGFGIAGTVEGVRFLSYKDKNDADHAALNAEDFCDPSKPHGTQDLAALAQACDNVKAARSALLLEGIFYGIAALGVGTSAVLLLTDHSSESASPAPRPLRWSFVPSLGVGSGSLGARLRF